MRYSELGGKCVLSKRKSSSYWELIHVSGVDHNDKLQFVVLAVRCVSANSEQVSFWYTISWSTKKELSIYWKEVRKCELLVLNSEGRKSFNSLRVRPPDNARRPTVCYQFMHICMRDGPCLYVLIHVCVYMYAGYVCLCRLCMDNIVYSLLYMRAIYICIKYGSHVWIYVYMYTGYKKKLCGLSPQANYTDRATAAVGEVVPTFAGRGVLRSQRNGSPRPLISIF
jgi:hypothetical protein